MVKQWELTEAAQLETANWSLTQGNDKERIMWQSLFPLLTQVIGVSWTEFWAV